MRLQGKLGHPAAALSVLTCQQGAHVGIGLSRGWRRGQRCGVPTLGALQLIRPSQLCHVEHGLAGKLLGATEAVQVKRLNAHGQTPRPGRCLATLIGRCRLQAPRQDFGADLGLGFIALHIRQHANTAHLGFGMEVGCLVQRPFVVHPGRADHPGWAVHSGVQNGLTDGRQLRFVFFDLRLLCRLTRSGKGLRQSAHRGR